MNKQQLEKRVKQVAEKVLDEHHYVSSIDILLGIGYLHPSNLDDWQKGQIPYLERVMQVNLNKINLTIELFRQWAIGQGLKPSEIKYLARTRGSKKELRFSQSGNPNIEKTYRTHYVSPLLSEKKQKKLKEKLEKSPEHVVFCVTHDTQCGQCHKALLKGNFLYKEQDEVLCMQCCEFSSLVFLPAGDAKLTRRAKQYSQIYVVVVKYSRARKRYERQGLLIQEKALEKAEKEIVADKIKQP